MKFKSFFIILLLLLPLLSVLFIPPIKADPIYTNTYFDFDLSQDGINFSNTATGWTRFSVTDSANSVYEPTLGYGFYDVTDVDKGNPVVLAGAEFSSGFNTTFYTPWDLIKDNFAARAEYDYDFGIKIHVPRGCYQWTLYYGDINEGTYYTLIPANVTDDNLLSFTGIYSLNSSTYGTITGISNTNQLDYLRLNIYGNSSTSRFFAIHIEFLYNNPTYSATTSINTTILETTCITSTVSAYTSTLTSTIFSPLATTSFETTQATGTTTVISLYLTTNTTDVDEYTIITSNSTTYGYTFTTTRVYVSLNGTITILEFHSITELNPATITETITETTTEPTTITTTELTTSISYTTTTNPNTQTTCYSTCTTQNTSITSCTTNLILSTVSSTSVLTIGTETFTTSIITTTLTTYQTTTEMKVDFGGDASPIQSGWTRLGATNGYATSPGYGWVDSSGTPIVLAQVDRGSGSGGALDDLEQDIHYTGIERWFKINVGTAGVYAWTLYYGDNGYAHGPFDIDDNNGHVVDGLSSGSSVWSHYHGSTDTGAGTFLYIKIKNPVSNPAFNGIEWSRTFGVQTSVITTSNTCTSSTLFTTTTVTQCSTTTSIYTTCTTTISTTIISSTYSTTFCETSVYSSTSSTTTCDTSVYSSTSTTTTCDTSVYSSTSSTTLCVTSVYSSTSSTTFCVTSVYSSTSSTTTCNTSIYSSTSSTTICSTSVISSTSTTVTCSSITNLQCSTETTDITCATISGTSTYTDATTTVTNFTETSIVGVIGGGCSWCIPLLMLLLILAVAYIVIRKRG